MARLAFPCVRFLQPRSTTWCHGAGLGSSKVLQFEPQDRLKGVRANAEKNDVGSLEWMSQANPYEVLGVTEECTEQQIKDAFRARVKEYHPDVYKGADDANGITQLLIRAYELLSSDTSRLLLLRRRDADPFEEPECVAEDVFVNELRCIGRSCPYSCVQRAPDVFTLATDTGRARAVSQGQGSEYSVYTAAGQCPRNCIHFVTPLQRKRLEEILQRCIENPTSSDEVALLMEGLIARARFENGRYQPPKKRQPKSSDKWVDWY